MTTTVEVFGRAMEGVANAAAVKGKLSNPTFVDSKAFGWFLENTTVWTLMGVRSMLPEPHTVKWKDEDGKPTSTTSKLYTILRNIVISYASSVLSEVGSVYAIALIDYLFFQHVPHFTRQRRSASPLTWNAFADWADGNGWLQYLGGGVALGICESFWPEWLAKEFAETPFSFPGFLRNFAIFRVVVDIVFYCAHRAMHEVPWIYDYVHRRHHEHYLTNLRTNWHFGAIDLFVESAVPIGFGFLVLRLLGIKLGRFELHLLQQYTAFHETGTHVGKPLQLISTYPPLSVFYHAVFPWIDRDGIAFHEAHHNMRSVNLGITQWIDWLMGSRKLQRDVLLEASKRFTNGADKIA